MVVRQAQPETCTKLASLCIHTTEYGWAEPERVQRIAERELDCSTVINLVKTTTLSEEGRMHEADIAVARRRRSLFCLNHVAPLLCI